MKQEKYKVKSGDTLSNIAKRYNVNIGDISGFRSGNPNLIYPNETLKINLNDYAGSGTDAVSTGNVPTDTISPNLDLNYVFGAGDSNRIKDNATNTYKELQKGSQDITNLYDQLKNKEVDRENYVQKYGIREGNKSLSDAENQLKLLQSQRESIPLEQEQNVEGRGITDAGLAPHVTSALRLNTIQQMKKAAQVELLNNNIKSSTMLIDEAIKAEYEPIEKKLDYEKQKYEQIYNNYTKIRSKYNSDLAALAKYKISQLKSDSASIAKQKEFSGQKEKMLLLAASNEAPASVLDAMKNTNSLVEILKAGGKYVMNVSSYKKAYLHDIDGKDNGIVGHSLDSLYNINTEQNTTNAVLKKANILIPYNK